MDFFKKGFGKMSKVGEIVAGSVVGYDDPYSLYQKMERKESKF